MYIPAVFVVINAYQRTWIHIIDILEDGPKDFDEIAALLTRRFLTTKRFALRGVLMLMEERGYIEGVLYNMPTSSEKVKKFHLTSRPVPLLQKRQSYLVPA